MGLKETGVFVTKEEKEEMMSLADRGWREGDRVMVTSVQEGIDKDQATIDVEKACHALALKYGLPEIEGYYGLDMDGQFMTVEE